MTTVATRWPSVEYIKTNIETSAAGSSVCVPIFGLQINEGLSDQISVSYLNFFTSSYIYVFSEYTKILLNTIWTVSSSRRSIFD